MSKTRLPVRGSIGKSLRATDPTTDIAALSAKVIQLQALVSQLLARGSGPSGSSGLSVTDWSLITNIPPDVRTRVPGPEGQPGADGAAGPPGVAGRDGIIGVNGNIGPPGRGEDGADGNLGPPGAPGPAGANGSNGLNGSTTLAYANPTVPAGNTVANTTSETAFASTYSIPGLTLAVGSLVRFKLFGVFSTALVAPTTRWKVKLGAVVMLDSGVLSSVMASATDAGWSVEGQFIVQSTGASGTLEAQGNLTFQNAVGSSVTVPIENAAPITIDTTIAEALSTTLTWGTASASNTATLREMAVWVENAQIPLQGVNVQVFAAGGTWTKPAGAKTVSAVCIAGGGGGGSGVKGATSTTRGAGGGGAGGGYSATIFQASDLSATETVTVGAAGTGGAAIATNSTNGATGVAGGTSSFGPYLQALGGLPGAGGTSTASGAGGATGAGLISGGGTGGSVGGAAPIPTASNYGGSGGGSGGALSSGNVLTNAQAGATGPLMYAAALTAGTAGTAGVNGGNGAAAIGWAPGSGGGGGGGNLTAGGNGGNGGAGGGFAGGGGGGGGSTNPSTGSAGQSGAGGAGAPGLVVVVTYF